MVKLKIERIDFKKFFTGGRISFAFALIFTMLLLANIIFSPVYYSGEIREGEIALRSIYAPYDFEYPWGINEKKTKEIRQSLEKSSPVVFDIDSSHQEEAIRNLTNLLDNVKSVKEVQDSDKRKEALESVKKKSNIFVRDKILLYIAGIKDKEDVKIKLIDILRSVYPLGIIDSNTQKELLKEARPVKIRNVEIKTERVRPLGDILTKEDAQKVSAEYISRIFPRDGRLRNCTSELIAASVSPNLIFNEQETKRIKDEALKKAPPAYDMIEVKKNELIAERGKRITKQHIAQLAEVGAVGSITHKGPYLAGMLLLLIILIVIGTAYLFIVEKKIIASPKKIAIILINSFIVILIGQFIIQFPQSNYIIPLSGAAMLIALLVSSNSALLASFLLSIFLGVMAGGKIELALALFVGGVIGTYVVRDARRRSRIILAGFAAGSASLIAVTSIGLLNNLDFKIFIHEGLWGLGGGILSIFLVMGFLPLFEYLFKIPTNITLLELSDLNHPLLKELTLKAPGTYQHSVVVGNLAEAACEAIGANSLLARVGSYYHDIGKIEKAEYFSENEMGAQSKHEKLTPSMSALIIINHVKDGIELAKKYNLNPKIIDFIAEHHGTGLIYYFYQRALEKVKDEEILKEEEFRYLGPKPQTKEAAIVLLADSVEASSRTLSDPVPARIMGLVQKIINNKFIDNQLDECDLTLKDLNKIVSSFVRVLTAVFHARQEYPEKKNNGIKKRNNKSKRYKSKPR
ncbi:MAG: HDIG domain-containing protein [Candidatus Omnitrophica bacterium]|nr:HDIG domain-containing protein [Candidatus Omnitrophota bacterium]